MPPRLVSKCFIVLFFMSACCLQAAEYKNAEMTPPRSVDEVDSTLVNVAGSILFYRGPVIRGIDDWRKTRPLPARNGR